MITRRRFLNSLALLAASSHGLLAQEKRRSRWDIITNDDPTRPAPYAPRPLSWSDDAITACWIGHATVLVNFSGVNILTDPVFSERVGLNIAGLFTVGPKPLVAPGRVTCRLRQRRSSLLSFLS